MKSHDFITIKNDIIAKISEIKSTLNYRKIYIVRNIYSRFSIYYTSESEMTDNIMNQIKSDYYYDWIDSIEFIENEFLENELQKTSTEINDSLYYSERRINTNNWYSVPEKINNVISFYSFKGGVGRTTAMILSAIELVRQGKRIVLLDFDLEAPGIASVFSTSENEYYSNKGIIDFFIDINANKSYLDKSVSSMNIVDYYFTITKQDIIGTNGGELIIFPAASTSLTTTNNYIDKLSKVDLTFNENKVYLPDILFTTINEKISPDYILVDSRTGINEIAGVLLTRYSSKIFLLFYGNQQNMFGLESIIEIIEKSNNSYILVNSPTPLQDTDKEEEINYYVEKSYEILCKYSYKDDIPDIDDQMALHYPINVPYSYHAVNFNPSKFNRLLEENGNNNSYKAISQLIDSNDDNPTITDEEIKTKNTQICEFLSKITLDDIAVSEDEFKEEEDLINFFYPRKDYRYMFEPNKFLILGDKGTGKTALFSVLNHHDYARHLAEYCGVNSSLLQHSKWITAFDKGANFPSQNNFKQLNNYSKSQITNYWLILLTRSILLEYPNLSDEFDNIKNCRLSELKNHAKDESLTEQIEDFLTDLDEKLTSDGDIIFFVYDYLDFALSPEENMRGRYIGALISLWHDYHSRFKNIKSKIFLRNDIFEREVSTETDKVKILNQAMIIEWTYDQLLNVVWKRLISNYYKSEIIKDLFKDFLPFIDFTNENNLGVIPNLSEVENRKILDILLGKYMGANNKAFPYNWIIYHTSDANKKMFPRSILTLFSSTGKKQLEDTREFKYPLRPFNMEISMDKVSQDRVVDLSEEYPLLRSIFKDLNSVVQNFPITEEELLEGIAKLGFSDPIGTIAMLNEIGVIYPYKYSSKKYGKRYHIPDLYLFGMNLKRRGPGAHRVLFKNT